MAEKMNVLVVGGGGREHALVWALAQSPQAGRIACAPGNAGIARYAECVEIDDYVRFCREHNVGLVVIGPEAPLADGLADTLTKAGIMAFGPSAKAARLESSKGFARDLCAEVGVPVPRYWRFTDAASAKTCIRGRGAPIVVKADGLAAGKGVVVAQTMDEANAAIDRIFSGAFDDAPVALIEECLIGEEASFFALCDGTYALPFGGAQDHKRIGEGDTGANTGGMGAYTPAPILDEKMCDAVMARIITPTLRACVARGHPFKGVLYAGLMITRDGPMLIEFNVRFGDPECQALMMRLDCDLLPLLVAACQGTLKGQKVAWKSGAALCVVMATRGYPDAYEKGSMIRGVEKTAAPHVNIHHAGTARAADGTLRANGGRVLNITALGDSVGQAAERAYAALAQIDWPEGVYRRDIGKRAIDRERGNT